MEKITQSSYGEVVSCVGSTKPWSLMWSWLGQLFTVKPLRRKQFGSNIKS